MKSKEKVVERIENIENNLEFTIGELDKIEKEIGKKDTELWCRTKAINEAGFARIASMLEDLIFELKDEEIASDIKNNHDFKYFKEMINKIYDVVPKYKRVYKQKNGKYAICDGYTKIIQFEDKEDKIAQALYSKTGDEHLMSYDYLKYIGNDKYCNKFKKIDLNYLNKLVEYNKNNHSKIPYTTIDFNFKDFNLDAEDLLNLLKLNKTDKIIINSEEHYLLPFVTIKSKKYSCKMVAIYGDDEATDEARNLQYKILCDEI